MSASYTANGSKYEEIGVTVVVRMSVLGVTDIHTLSRQKGNSAAMIERHNSKLTATLAADRFA